jgi:hypothetical protein
MSAKTIDAEIVEEEIILTCKSCGQRNRLYKRSETGGVYKCGACRAALANSFLPPTKQPMPAMRVLRYVTAAIVALLVLITIVAGIALSPQAPGNQEAIRKASERDARIDKLINEIGPSALPPIPPLSHADSHPMSLPPSTPPVAVAGQPALPANVPATVTPVNNAILFDAFPHSTTRGQLTVSNGSSRHAVAKLIDIQNDTKILSFVACAGKQSTIEAIPNGYYRLIFAFGDRLYIATDRFESPRGFSKFDRPLTFTTANTVTDTDDATYYRTRYTTLSVTLTPVIGGNVTTSSISRSDFEKY